MPGRTALFGAAGDLGLDADDEGHPSLERSRRGDNGAGFGQRGLRELRFVDPPEVGPAGEETHRAFRKASHAATRGSRSPPETTRSIALRCGDHGARGSELVGSCSQSWLTLQKLSVLTDGPEGTFGAQSKTLAEGCARRGVEDASGMSELGTVHAGRRRLPRSTGLDPRSLRVTLSPRAARADLADIVLPGARGLGSAARVRYARDFDDEASEVHSETVPQETKRLA